MIRVPELSGAWLDYLVARAVGFPAEQLEVRQVPRTDEKICVGGLPGGPFRVPFSTDWAWCGPLIEKHMISLDWGVDPLEWRAHIGGGAYEAGDGPTALVAACRGIVATKFGKEVPEVAP
jgi:hypothetical protein